jgi:hypothetical protein
MDSKAYKLKSLAVPLGADIVGVPDLSAFQTTDSFAYKCPGAGTMKHVKKSRDTNQNRITKNTEYGRVERSIFISFRSRIDFNSLFILFQTSAITGAD